MRFSKWSNLAVIVYGNGWQTMLAKKLGVTDRTVRNWIASQAALSETHASVLRAEHLARLSVLLDLFLTEIEEDGFGDAWGVVHAAYAQVRDLRNKHRSAASQAGL